jgi:hypothetical protein
MSKTKGKRADGARAGLVSIKPINHPEAQKIQSLRSRGQSIVLRIAIRTRRSSRGCCSPGGPGTPGGPGNGVHPEAFSREELPLGA